MRPFAACPRAEKLHRVTRRLRPATVDLQCLVEFVAEVPFLLFCHQAGALLRRGRSGGLTHGAIPVVRPLAEAFLTDGIDVRRATKAMQAERAATKRDAQRLLGGEAVLPRELFEHLVQCACERWGDQTMLRRRGHAIGLTARNRLQCGVARRLLGRCWRGLA